MLLTKNLRRPISKCWIGEYDGTLTMRYVISDFTDKFVFFVEIGDRCYVSGERITSSRKSKGTSNTQRVTGFWALIRVRYVIPSLS